MLSTPGQAQDREKPAAPEQTHRLELESDSFNDEHWVQPLTDSTLLLISTKNGSWFSKSDFLVTHYNHQLEQRWQLKEEHKTGTELYKVAQDGNQVYLLFSTREIKKLWLYRVDLQQKTISKTEHVLPNSYINLQEMSAVQGNVFLSGLENYKLSMLHLDPAEEEIRRLPAVYGMEDDLGDFRIDTLTKAVEFVVAESNGIRSRVQTKRLNPKGEVIGTYFLQPPINSREDNTLQVARLTPGDTLTKRLIGTFGYRTNIFAKGLFSSDLTGNLKLYDFPQLSYFFDYLPARRQRRLKAKFAKREAQGKPHILRYRLLLHPILQHPQGYALVGEIYYPQYRSQTYVTNSPGSFTHPDGRRLFDGFRFTHAIVCVFDRQGNLLWDNSYKLPNETYPELVPQVEAGVLPDGRIAMVYLEDEELHHKTVKPGASISDEEKFKVRTQSETEKLVGSNREGVSYWYGNTFVAFGFQRIRPAQGESRTVFYLQNLQFK